MIVVAREKNHERRRTASSSIDLICLFGRSIGWFFDNNTDNQRRHDTVKQYIGICILFVSHSETSLCSSSIDTHTHTHTHPHKQRRTNRSEPIKLTRVDTNPKGSEGGFLLQPSYPSKHTIFLALHHDEEDEQIQ